MLGLALFALVVTLWILVGRFASRPPSFSPPYDP